MCVGMESTFESNFQSRQYGLFVANDSFSKFQRIMYSHSYALFPVKLTI